MFGTQHFITRNRGVDPETASCISLRTLGSRGSFPSQTLRLNPVSRDRFYISNTLAKSFSGVQPKGRSNFLSDG
jgi:hypothetical protein